ncbi:hypothetical protein K432DRAFT_409819 [Lepidopterella palustris CBS 459.81]|uniref:Uncharacterized protein n=1 Tax=Lepidopterella palustris CBS 459.81 TaxID=1314670 RepID=A0A8E2DZC2_9PEZI|nr:hypothetical protein K432DRAFT_409819 [Lepidopterella palustris CBS 459.81]
METDPAHRKPRGPQPETAYRCRNLETLETYLRDELQSRSESLIPEMVTAKFLFSVDAIINVSEALQENLPSSRSSNGSVPNALHVEQTLYRTTGGKERVKPQIAIAKSVVNAVQRVDCFKYTERQAWGYIQGAKEGSGDDGTRFKFVCVDSLQNRD